MENKKEKMEETRRYASPRVEVKIVSVEQNILAGSALDGNVSDGGLEEMNKIVW